MAPGVKNPHSHSLQCACMGIGGGAWLHGTATGYEIRKRIAGRGKGGYQQRHLQRAPLHHARELYCLPWSPSSDGPLQPRRALPPCLLRPRPLPPHPGTFVCCSSREPGIP